MTRKTVTELSQKAVSQTQHLMQRGARWYYNRAWPLHLQDQLGASPFRKSLRTESKSEAIRAKPEAEREFWARVDAAEAKATNRKAEAPTDAQAQSLALEFFRGLATDLEGSLADAQRDPQALHEQQRLASEKLAQYRRELTEEGGGQTSGPQ